MEAQKAIAASSMFISDLRQRNNFLPRQNHLETSLKKDSSSLFNI
jgi:hypothetical protein